MTNFPGLVDQGHEIVCKPIGTSPYYTTVTAGAANTKGSFATIGTCPAGWGGVPTVVIHGTSADTGTYLIDFIVASSFADVVTNFFFSMPTTQGYQEHFTVTFPIRVTAGATLQARCQADGGSDVLWMSTIFHPIGAFNSSQVLSQSVTWGANASGQTRGTELDPGTSADTKPATFTQIIAATAQDIKGFMICAGRSAVGSYFESNFMLDIAVGASSSEVVIVEDFGLVAHVNGDCPLPRVSPFFPIPIPAGTRISARVQCDATDIAWRLIDIVLVAFY